MAASKKSYHSAKEYLAQKFFYVICGLILLFLIMPILVIIPLSFNASPYFTFTPEMLAFDPEGYSLRWYQDLFASEDWMRSIRNSFFIASCATLIATILGTMAALGLSRAYMPYRTLIMTVLISPLIVPIIISAVGMFFFFVKLGLAKTYLGVILAHAVVGTPFVVITVTATLSGFDYNLVRAAQNLGASGLTIFFKIIAPIVSPGIISGALFAFVASFDEVVIILFVGGFDQNTVTVQMWSGLREQISPTILSVATLFFLISIGMLVSLELIRRRNNRLRGIME